MKFSQNPKSRKELKAQFILIFCFRHISRLLLIIFSLPEIGTTISNKYWKELMGYWEKTSLVIGYLISLEKMLKDKGFSEIEDKLVARVEQLLPGVIPRVIPGYAMLLWFTSKVCSLV